MNIVSLILLMLNIFAFAIIFVSIYPIVMNRYNAFIFENIWTSETFIISFSIIFCLLLLAAFLIFLSLYYVKKDYVMIILYKNQYSQTLSHGWYWFFPVAYKKGASYKIHNCVTIKTKNKNKIKINYEITDPKKLFDSKETIKSYVKKITMSFDTVTFDFLKTNLETIGINLLD